ncbi:MAG TPA: hypothetical protein VJ436_01865, partial [Anaerolineales bacterium]|nr:hypothetical protein [Anaerolineales bacterium]
IGIGAVVFAILRAGLLSLTGTGQTIASPFLMYIVAWLAGYQHNVFSDLVKRLLQVFKIGEDEDKVEGAFSLDIHRGEESSHLTSQQTETTKTKLEQ